MALCCHTLGLIFEDGGCVLPAECPCEFHGSLHPPGSVVTEDCNAWSVSTAWRDGPGEARTFFEATWLGLGKPEKTRVTHSASETQRDVIRFVGGGVLFTSHFRNWTLWDGAWDSVWALRAGRPPS